MKLNVFADFAFVCLLDDVCVVCFEFVMVCFGITVV